MNNHAMDVVAVVCTWFISAVFTFVVSTASLVETQKVRKVDSSDKEERVVITGQRTPQTASQEIKAIEKKLEKAEDDLVAIIRLIQERKAVENAIALDKSEDKERK